MADKKPSPPIWNAERLRIATDAAGVALWMWHVDTDAIAMDERAHELWGVSDGHVTFEDLSARIHPLDLDRVRAVFAATREILGPYEVDFRILHHDHVRWISARGRGNDHGIVGRTMFGVFLNVTERKMAEEARELITGEMAHRIRNLFSIASALAAISARSAATPEEMSRDLTQRLIALGRAQNLALPALSEQRAAVPLGDLLGVLFAPYVEESVGERVRIDVPNWTVGEKSVTTLALVVHELATNSIKYGALSNSVGTLDVSGVAHDTELIVTWAERGGPPVVHSDMPAGFGTQLILRTISSQLGGTIAFEWAKEGVTVTLTMNKGRLGA